MRCRSIFWSVANFSPRASERKFCSVIWVSGNFQLQLAKTRAIVITSAFAVSLCAHRAGPRLTPAPFGCWPNRCDPMAPPGKQHEALATPSHYTKRGSGDRPVAPAAAMPNARRLSPGRMPVLGMIFVPSTAAGL